MSISQLFPAISPSLSLNFARSKTLDPRITFTRTSSGTRTNDTGLVEVVPANSPRFDHYYDPVSGTVRSLGLLVEEQRTNLVTDNTTDFNYSIANQSIATANDVAPNGTTVLCKHDLTGATSPFLNCNVDTTLTAGTYTMSMWLKGTTSYSASFAFVGETTNEIYANTANITTLWQRFTLTFTLINTQNNSRLQLFFATQGENKVISIWGAQLETGAFVTSYIPRPVAGQQATRTADNVSMVGENFSSWYNQSEGTIFCEYNRPSAVTSLRTIIAVSDNGFANRTNFRTDSATNLTIFTAVGGVGQTVFNLIMNSGANNKSICAYKLNDYNAASNGTIGTNDTSATVPIVDRMSIGSVLGAEPSCSYIRTITYYPRRLTNSQLQNLTK